LPKSISRHSPALKANYYSTLSGVYFWCLIPPFGALLQEVSCMNHRVLSLMASNPRV